jgi:hypothetical protein
MSNNTVNSFTETVNNLVGQVNIALESLNQINASMTTQEDSVPLTIQQVDPLTGDSSTVTYSIPSFINVTNKLNAVTQTMDVFTKGEGVVLLKDGTYREVKTVPVPISPAQITNVDSPTKFNVRTNWFFESMMFPQLIITFDLKGKIDDRSDRVLVKRVIFDNVTPTDTQWFLDNIIGKQLSYSDTITYLNTNNKNYFEDQEIQELPLFAKPYTGMFLITDKKTIDGKDWLFLDTLNYGVTSDTPVVKNIQLSVGDELRYNNSILKIDMINVSESRIHVIPLVGLETPTVSFSFEIYTEPFQHKYTQIPVGFDECDIIFIKGINDDFNLLADSWSTSIPFYTNNLILTNSTTTLENYYNNFVSDFGRQLEGQAREKFVPAYFGVIPDAPIFTADQFAVSQINTQLNAAIDTDSVKSTQTQIESTKTIINSLKSTIAQQKAELVSLTDPSQRSDLQSKIDANTSELSKRTVEYQSLVKSLATLAYENNTVVSNPKYRARGFFNIPSPKIPTNQPNAIPQEVISFDIAYRYLKLDGTASSLNNYTFTDPSTGQTFRGVFTDWIIIQSAVKEKVYDSSLGLYKWINSSISDGDIVNINQVDLPIQKGEILQLKIRSISEAGYPLNPLKSDWSSPVNIQFPANLSTSDQVNTILTDAVSEENTIALQQTLDSTGLTTHIDDSTPNPSSTNGSFFKHQSSNLAYTQNTKSHNGVITLSQTGNLQNFIDNLPTLTNILIVDPCSNQYTTTLQLVVQEIVRNLPGFNFSNI